MLKGFKLGGRRRILLRALDLFATPAIDFEDASTIAQLERAGLTTILDCDRHFDRVPSVQRREP